MIGIEPLGAWHTRAIAMLMMRLPALVAAVALCSLAASAHAASKRATPSDPKALARCVRAVTQNVMPLPTCHTVWQLQCALRLLSQSAHAARDDGDWCPPPVVCMPCARAAGECV